MPYSKFHNSKIKDYYPNPLMMLAKALYNIVCTCLIWGLGLYITFMILRWFALH